MALTVGRSTESEVEQFTQRHRRYFVSREYNAGVATSTFIVRNTWLSVLKLEPPTRFRAFVGVKSGRLDRIRVELSRSMDIYPTFQASAGMVDEYAEYPQYFSPMGPYEFPTPVGKPYLLVRLNSHATPIQRQHAFGFSFECLIKPGWGCDLPCDYLPAAWQDWKVYVHDVGLSDAFKEHYPKS